jgi:hypothetical protein
MRIARSMSDDEGISALHSAVESGNADMVRYLLERGARTDILDWSGRTPLDVANGVPRKPLPLDAGDARIPDPYAPEAEGVEEAPALAPGGGRGGRGGEDEPEGMAEIRALLEEAAAR